MAYPPPVTGKPGPQGLIDAMDEESFIVFPFPTKADTNIGAQKSRQTGQGTVKTVQQIVQNVQSARVTSKLHACRGLFMGFHGQ